MKEVVDGGNDLWHGTSGGWFPSAASTCTARSNERIFHVTRQLTR
ncbi:hypothetical protein ACFO1B_52065 [Dactylosporangium siamense]|nr:hypothetical protein [Dactylosporangium siamense]